jgi:hypothetical protein
MRRHLAAAVLVLLSAAGCGTGDDGSTEAGPAPSTTTTTTAPVAFPGIWPFTSQAEADAYTGGGDTVFRDAIGTAREFARRYVGMVEPVAVGGATPSGGAVEVRIGFGTGEGGRPLQDPRPTMTVRLQRVGDADGDRDPWTVVGATSEQIVVDAPEGLDGVTSPLPVAGRAHTFEGNVAVEVREDGMVAGQSLGTGFVTGGGDALRPFSGRVAFRAPAKPAGSVLFYEASPADGQGVLRATVVRVRFT